MNQILAACRRSPPDFMFMGEDGTPITILVGYDGLTKAFFANFVPFESTSHGYAERALAHNVLSTDHQKVILQSDQETSIMDLKHKVSTHVPTEIVYEESPVGDSNANVALSERTKPSKDRFVQSRTTLNDRLVRRLVLTAPYWNGLYVMRHGHWRRSTLAVMVRQLSNVFEANHSINRSHCSASKSCSSHKTTGPQQKLALNWMDGCWLGFNTRKGAHREQQCSGCYVPQFSDETKSAFSRVRDAGRSHITPKKQDTN